MQQITLPIISHSHYNLEEFIISESNYAVYNAINNWHELWGTEPFRYTLMISGPKSSGKTYITKIWQHKSGAVYLDPDMDVSIVEDNGKNAFIIEDIELWPEDLLFHFFNAINNSKKYLLLSSIDKNINFRIKDIDSRIKSVYNLEIKPPDDNLIKLLLFKHFAENSIILPNKIFAYLLPRIPRECDKIIEIANRINQFALAQKRPITIPLIKEIL